jgi:hypothetical protein
MATAKSRSEPVREMNSSPVSTCRFPTSIRLNAAETRLYAIGGIIQDAECYGDGTFLWTIEFRCSSASWHHRIIGFNRFSTVRLTTGEARLWEGFRTLLRFVACPPAALIGTDRLTQPRILPRLRSHQCRCERIEIPTDAGDRRHAL